MRKLDIGGHEYKVRFMDGEKRGEGNKYLFGIWEQNLDYIY